MSIKKRVPSRIPQFKTVQEAAEFWDKHSTEDSEDYWEPTDLEFAPDWKSIRLFTVTIEYSLYRQLRARAEAQSVTAEELAAAWIESRLAEATDAAADGSSADTGASG